MTKKKDDKLFRYNHDECSHVIMDIIDDAEKTVKEAYETTNIRKGIRLFEAGYRQALIDYKVPHPGAEDSNVQP